jgi:hypothetical protein
VARDLSAGARPLASAGEAALIARIAARYARREHRSYVRG